MVSICVCWPHKRRVYNITSSSLLHRKYFLLPCCLLKVSQHRLVHIDAASVHIVKGISQHIHNKVGYTVPRVLRFPTHTISSREKSSWTLFKHRIHVGRVNLKPSLPQHPTTDHPSVRVRVRWSAMRVTVIPQVGVDTWYGTSIHSSAQ